jgi:hypothetical protein
MTDLSSLHKTSRINAGLNRKSLRPTSVLVASLLLLAMVTLSVLDTPAHLLMVALVGTIALLFKRFFFNSTPDFLQFFFTSYLIDLVVGALLVVYWLQLYGTQYAFESGMSDHVNYWKFSNIPLGDFFRRPRFSDHGFYLMNRFVYFWFAPFGKNSYLLHLQMVWAGGALMRSYARMLIFTFSSQKSRTIDLFLLWYPKLLFFSTGLLLRDIIIAMGVTMATVEYLAWLQGRRRFLPMLIGVGLISLAIFQLRKENALAIGMIIMGERIATAIFVNGAMQRKILTIVTCSSILVASWGGILYWGGSFQEQTERENKALYSRHDKQVSQGSATLGTQLLTSRSPLALASRPFYNLLSYFPFFHKWVLLGLVQSLTVIQGIGSLIWQLLLVQWVLGVRKLFAMRSAAANLILIGAAVYVISIAIILPDVRYTFPGEAFLLTPLFVGKGIRIKNIGYGFFLVVILYIIYFLLKTVH